LFEVHRKTDLEAIQFGTPIQVETKKKQKTSTMGREGFEPPPREQMSKPTKSQPPRGGLQTLCVVVSGVVTRRMY
jgi:hypothetical protein